MCLGMLVLKPRNLKNKLTKNQKRFLTISNITGSQQIKEATQISILLEWIV